MTPRNWRRFEQRIEKRYDMHGCDRCHSRVSIGHTVHVTVLGEAVCEACLLPSDDLIANFVVMSAGASALADDRAWFEAHPEQNHRVRMPYPGEEEEYAAALHAVLLLNGDTLRPREQRPHNAVVVVQIEPRKVARDFVMLPVAEPERTRMVAAVVANLKASRIIDASGLSPELKMKIANAAALRAVPGFADDPRELGIAVRESQDETKH